MNIFDLPLDQIDKEMDKLLSQYNNPEELLDDLIECGLEVDEEAMKKHNLRMNKRKEGKNVRK